MTENHVKDWPIVYSLHGIRTTGKWQKQHTDELLQHGFRHIPLDYGYFPAILLMLPWGRRWKLSWLLDVYDKEISSITPPPAIIAHSFGTYLLAKAMAKNGLMRFGRIIMCGSIVPRDYPWSQILVDRKQAEAVLHEAGGKDFWAKIVCWVVADAGPSGVEGFEDLAPVAGDRKLVHEIVHAQHEHSDYFFLQNYRLRWIPFLEGNLPTNERALPNPGRNWKFTAALTAVLAVTVVFVVNGVLHQSKSDATHAGATVDSHRPPATGDTSAITTPTGPNPQRPTGPSPDTPTNSPGAAAAAALTASMQHPLPSSLVITSNKGCGLTIDAVEQGEIGAQNQTAFKVPPGAHSVRCDSGDSYDEKTVQAAPGQEMEVRLEIQDPAYVQQSRDAFKYLKGDWLAVWKDRKLRSAGQGKCALQIEAKAALRISQLDADSGVITGSWGNKTEITSSYVLPEVPYAGSLAAQDEAFGRRTCEDSSVWRLYSETKLPLQSTGVVRIEVDDEGSQRVSLNIATCRDLEGDCGGDYLGKEAEALYLTQRGYGLTDSEIRTIDASSFRLGDWEFERQ